MADQMLTRAQWLKGPRKSGTYARYLAWYNKNVRLPRNPLAPWTPHMQAAEVARRVNDIIQPQQKMMERELATKTASLRASSRQQADYLRSKIGTSQGIYNTAAEELKSLGGGYSDAMKARIQGAQDAAAQFASSQGAPPSAPAVDATALADTAYHGAVNIPGSSLAAQGANWAAMEAEQAGVPLLQGGADIRSAQADYEKQLLDLASKRPELSDQIANELFQNELRKQDARIKQQAQNLYSSQFANTIRHQRVTEAQGAARVRTSQARYNLAVQAHKDAMAKAATEGRRPNASLSRAYGYIVDSNGNPILDRNGKHIPVPKSGSAQSQKAKANAQYQKAVGEAAKMFSASKSAGVDKFGDPLPPKRAWKWGNAIRYLMNRYGLKRAGARRALIAAGFKPPPAPQRGRKIPPNPEVTQAPAGGYG
jgi:hypothetical protein